MGHVKLSNETDLAWAAGLIEGEGCFTCHSKHHPYFLLDMTDKDVVEKLQKVFPFCILRGPYTHAKRPTMKPRWRLDGFGPSAVKVMEAVLPYMGSRRTEKINLLLKNYNENIKAVG